MSTHLADDFAQGPDGSGGGLRTLPSMPRGLALADQILGLIVSVPAALLVMAEIALLFSGVVARYVFHQPLVWGDELASILFLWLAMTGAATALHRGSHMRMTAIVNRAGNASGALWDNVALVASLLFLAMIAAPVYAYINQQWGIVTPALEINDGFRVAAIVYGVVCMLLMSLVKLLARGWKTATVGIVVTAAVVAVLNTTGPVLQSLGNLNLVIFFVGVVGFTVLSGMPIAFSFGLAVFSYLSLSTSMPLEIVVSRMDEGMSQLLLLAVPMFIFLGLLIEMTGMARAMINFLAALLGHVRGGLSYVLVGAMYLISGISGSKAADMAAVAPILLPEMTKRGEKPGSWSRCCRRRARRRKRCRLPSC